MTKKQNKSKLRFLLMMLSVFSVICLMSPITLCAKEKEDTEDNRPIAHARVVLAPLNDPSTDSVQIEVVEEDDKKWRINDTWDPNYKNVQRATNGHPQSFTNGSEGEGSSRTSFCGGDSSYSPTNGSMGCVYLHYPGQGWDKEHGITAKDQQLAQYAANILQESFDTLVAFIKNNTDSSKMGDVTITEITKQLASNKIEESDNGSVSGSIEIADKSYTIQPLRNAGKTESSSPAKYAIHSGVGKGTSIDNFAVVSVANENDPTNYQIIQYSVPKGYAKATSNNTSEAQYAAGDYDATDEEAGSDPVYYVSMKGISYYSSNMEKSGVVVGDSGYKAMYGSENKVVGFFKSIFSNILKGLNSLLGISDTVELIFNRGSRSVSYYYGVLPYNYLDIAKIFFWVSAIVAGFVVFYSIYLIIVRRSVADISPAARIDLKQSIYSLITVVIMEIMFVPFFSLMCRANALIVNMFGALVSTEASLFDIGINGIGYIIVSFIIFGLTLAINIRYIIRSLTVALCYCIGPVAISTIALDERKTVFNVWLKELISNIFLQAFNAIILAFLLMVTANGRALMRIVILYALIPLNKWFMEDLCGAKLASGKVADEAGRSVDNGFNTMKRRSANMVASGLNIAAGAGGFMPMIAGIEGRQDKTSASGAIGKNALKGIPESSSQSKENSGNAVATSHDSQKFRKANNAAHLYNAKVGAAMIVGASTEMFGFNTGAITDRAFGSMVTKSERDRQNMFAAGYSGMDRGMIHKDKNGNIDAFATNKEEFDKLKGSNKYKDGSWESGTIASLDPNQFSEEERDMLRVSGVDKTAQGSQRFLADRFGNTFLVGADGIPLLDPKKSLSRISSQIQARHETGYTGIPHAVVGAVDKNGNLSQIMKAKHGNAYLPATEGSPSMEGLIKRDAGLITDFRPISPEDDIDKLKQDGWETGSIAAKENSDGKLEPIRSQGFIPAGRDSENKLGDMILCSTDSNGNISDVLKWKSGQELTQEDKNLANEHPGYRWTKGSVEGEVIYNGLMDRDSFQAYDQNEYGAARGAHIRNGTFGALNDTFIDPVTGEKTQEFKDLEQGLNRDNRQTNARVAEFGGSHGVVAFGDDKVATPDAIRIAGSVNSDNLRKASSSTVAPDIDQPRNITVPAEAGYIGPAVERLASIRPDGTLRDIHHALRNADGTYQEALNGEEGIYGYGRKDANGNIIEFTKHLPEGGEKHGFRKTTVAAETVQSITPSAFMVNPDDYGFNGELQKMSVIRISSDALPKHLSTDEVINDFNSASNGSTVLCRNGDDIQMVTTAKNAELKSAYNIFGTEPSAINIVSDSNPSQHGENGGSYMHDLPRFSDGTTVASPDIHPSTTGIAVSEGGTLRRLLRDEEGAYQEASQNDADAVPCGVLYGKGDKIVATCSLNELTQAKMNNSWELAYVHSEVVPAGSVMLSDEERSSNNLNYVATGAIMQLDRTENGGYVLADKNDSEAVYCIAKTSADGQAITAVSHEPLTPELSENGWRDVSLKATRVYTNSVMTGDPNDRFEVPAQIRNVSSDFFDHASQQIRPAEQAASDVSDMQIQPSARHQSTVNTEFPTPVLPLVSTTTESIPSVFTPVSETNVTRVEHSVEPSVSPSASVDVDESDVLDFAKVSHTDSQSYNTSNTSQSYPQHSYSNPRQAEPTTSTVSEAPVNSVNSYTPSPSPAYIQEQPASTPVRTEVVMKRPQGLEQVSGVQGGIPQNTTNTSSVDASGVREMSKQVAAAINEDARRREAVNVRDDSHTSVTHRPEGHLYQETEKSMKQTNIKKPTDHRSSGLAEKPSDIRKEVK